MILRKSVLSYPEKVRQVVAMQVRIAPILVVHGRIIKPWTLDGSCRLGQGKMV